MNVDERERLRRHVELVHSIDELAAAMRDMASGCRELATAMRAPDDERDAAPVVELVRDASRPGARDASEGAT